MLTYEFYSHDVTVHGMQSHVGLHHIENVCLHTPTIYVFFLMFGPLDLTPGSQLCQRHGFFNLP